MAACSTEMSLKVTESKQIHFNTKIIVVFIRDCLDNALKAGVHRRPTPVI